MSDDSMCGACLGTGEATLSDIRGNQWFGDCPACGGTGVDPHPTPALDPHTGDGYHLPASASSNQCQSCAHFTGPVKFLFGTCTRRECNCYSHGLCNFWKGK